MNTTRILGFLKAVAANNNRPWFQANKQEYEAVRNDFEKGVAKAIGRIADADPGVAHLSVKDCTYRFCRDTRFSNDKSPYKQHLGAYISAHGKKALHGGYYIHLEPGHCLLACGNYWLPTNILSSCRNEIMSNIDEWLAAVENEEFLKLFGRPGEGDWDSARGFGLSLLKKAPNGFPKDYEHLPYLRLKDYCCWHHVADEFFDGDAWLDDMMHTVRVAQPMVDFINRVIDDYE